MEDRLRIRDLQSQIEGYVQYGRDVSRVSSCATEIDVYYAYS